MRRNFDREEEDANSDELVIPADIQFDDYGMNRPSSAYVQRMESRQQLSGFVFCCVGSIILGFGCWLIHKGNTSHRTEELR